MRRWQQITGPKTILSIAKHGDCYLLGTNEGLWLWYATKTSCEIVAESLRSAMVSAVASGGQRIFVGASDGIAYSDDFGKVWQAALLPGKLQVSQIAVSPLFERDGMIFAATLQAGVLSSLDSGHNWSFTNLGLSDAEAVALALSPDFGVDLTMVVAVNTGAFMSSNLGRTWRLLPVEAVAMPAAGFAFAREALLVGSEGKGLYYSTDRGKAFAKRTTFSSGAINTLAVSPNSKLIGLATPQVVAVSSDFGATWDRTEGRLPRNVMSLAVLDNGTVMAGTQADGLWVY
jgi:ligand-binding sensor domain-containing protein